MGQSIHCIRKCGIDDLDELVRMRMEFLREAGHVKEGEDSIYNEILEYIRTHINRDLYFWVIEMDGKVAATGAINIWNKLPINASNNGVCKIGYFSNMYTRPEYRKKGMATCLMKHMLQFLKDEGIQKAMLHAMEDGKGIYRKLGFLSHESLMEMKI